MNRQINIAQFLEDARKANVSVHLLIKRFLHYRTGSGDRCCAKCRYKDEIKFTGETEARKQCHWIGHEKESHADLRTNGICDFFGGIWIYEPDEEQPELIPVKSKGAKR